MTLPPFLTHYPLWKLEELRKAGVPIERRLELVLLHLQAVDPDSVPEDLTEFLESVNDRTVEERIPRAEVRACIAEVEDLLEEERESLVKGAPSGESAARAAELLTTIPSHQRSSLWVSRAAQAHAFFANSLRIQGELSDASEEMLVARVLLRRKDDIDPVARVEVDDLTATLRRDELNYREAVFLYSRACSMALAIGREDLYLRSLIGQASVYNWSGHFSKALALTLEALQRLSDSTKHLEVFIRLNLVLFASSAGDLSTAREALPHLLEIEAETENKSLRLRCWWIEARYRSATGEEKRARELYEKVLPGFQELDRPYDLVLSVLDYALFLRLLPDIERVKRLAAEVEPYLDRTTLIAFRAGEILTSLKNGLQTTEDFRILSSAKLSIERGERPPD